MTKMPAVVFLFDVDNTLLDNDRVQADLKEHLDQTYGVVARDRYWAILEELRSELGYVDYLGALERFRIETIHRPDVCACRAGWSTIRLPIGSIPGRWTPSNMCSSGGPRLFSRMAMPCSSRARWSAPGSGVR